MFAGKGVKKCGRGAPELAIVEIRKAGGARGYF